MYDVFLILTMVFGKALSPLFFPLESTMLGACRLCLGHNHIVQYKIHGGCEAKVSHVDTAAKHIMNNKCVTEKSICLTALKCKLWYICVCYGTNSCFPSPL